MLLEDATTPIRGTRMVFTLNSERRNVLEKGRSSPAGDSGLNSPEGGTRASTARRGLRRRVGPVESWDYAILQGPHILWGTRSTSHPTEPAHQQDWSPIDLETLEADECRSRRTSQPWRQVFMTPPTPTGGNDRVPARSQYRVAWRSMAANTGDDAHHRNHSTGSCAHPRVFRGGVPRRSRGVIDTASIASTLIADTVVRTAPRAGIPQRNPPSALRHSTQRSCGGTRQIPSTGSLTTAIRSLIREVFLRTDRWQTPGWRTTVRRPPGSRAQSRSWSADTPLRRAGDRRQAQALSRSTRSSRSHWGSQPTSCAPSTAHSSPCSTATTASQLLRRERPGRAERGAEGLAPKG